MKGKKDFSGHRLWIHLLFILICLTFILPFILVISVSLSSEDAIRQFGYRLIPKSVDFLSYRFIFRNSQQMLDSYRVTFLQTALGTILSVTIMTLCAYPLSQQRFKYRGPITFFIFFTMLFGGGLVPTYILVTQYLGLGNKFWVYIFMNLANAFHIVVFRTFFQQLPESLPESAKIDGASEFRIYFQIILPLSKPVLATIALFAALDRWNNWFISLIYVRDNSLYTLQYLLQRILMEVQFIQNMARDLPPGIVMTEDFKIPSEGMRFAMAIVAAGPMLVIFPFFQKYFTKGLTIGAIKG